MDFNKLALEKLVLLLSEFSIQLMEQSANELRFASPYVTIRLVHSPFENSITLWLGTTKLTEIEIHDDLVSAFFGEKIQINSNLPQAYIENLMSFFAGKGKILLQENEAKCLELERFVIQKYEEYNKQIQLEQLKRNVDFAWSQNRFEDIIKLLDTTSLDLLPPSYRQKYNMAKKK